MHDYVNNNLPASFKNTFSYNRDIQTIRQTRQSDLLYISRCKTKFASKLPLYALPKIWNDWAKISSHSRPKFKKHVKSDIILGYLGLNARMHIVNIAVFVCWCLTSPLVTIMDISSAVSRGFIFK